MSLMKTVGALAAALLLGSGAQATYIVLPDANAMSAGQYGDFTVFSLDLLAQCKQATDVRCTAYKGDYSAGGLERIKSGEGGIADQVMIMTGTSGNQVTNYDNSTGPFAGQLISAVQVDNPFLTPGGNPEASTSFDMTSNEAPLNKIDHGEEPGGNTAEFTRDVEGRWDAKLSSIVSYLGANAPLIFLFDNNQTGAAAVQFFWGQVEITDAAGIRIACYELNNRHSGLGVFTDTQSCQAEPPTFDLDAALAGTGNNYQSSGGRFCTNAVTGASYAVGPDNNNPCNAGDFYVTNNLGSNTAEFAAYVRHLNNNLAAWAAAGYYLSMNYKMRMLNDGNESMWIPNGQPNLTPEPGGLALASLALLGLAAASRRRRNVNR